MKSPIVIPIATWIIPNPRLNTELLESPAPGEELEELDWCEDTF
jgi:hypothetical protein